MKLQKMFLKDALKDPLDNIFDVLSHIYMDLDYYDPEDKSIPDPIVDDLPTLTLLDEPVSVPDIPEDEVSPEPQGLEDVGCWFWLTDEEKV